MSKFICLKEVFEAAADGENSIRMAAYMKDNFVFYGIVSPERKLLTKPFIKAEKAEKNVDGEFMDACYEDAHREFQYFANDCLTALGKYITFDDIPKLKSCALNKP